MARNFKAKIMGMAILIVKRSLNVALIMTILWSIFLVIVLMIALSTKKPIQESFITEGVFHGALGYCAILAINYIFLGRFKQ